MSLLLKYLGTFQTVSCWFLKQNMIWSLQTENVFERHVLWDGAVITSSVICLTKVLHSVWRADSSQQGIKHTARGPERVQSCSLDDDWLRGVMFQSHFNSEQPLHVKCCFRGFVPRPEFSSLKNHQQKNIITQHLHCKIKHHVQINADVVTERQTDWVRENWDLLLKLHLFV